MALLTSLGSAQQTHVPEGFLYLLMERVAAYLDLDDAKVRQIVDEAAKKAREQAQMQGIPLPAPGTPAGNLQDAVAGALGAVNGAEPPPAGPAPESAAP